MELLGRSTAGGEIPFHDSQSTQSTHDDKEAKRRAGFLHLDKAVSRRSCGDSCLEAGASRCGTAGVCDVTRPMVRACCSSRRPVLLNTRIDRVAISAMAAAPAIAQAFQWNRVPDALNLDLVWSCGSTSATVPPASSSGLLYTWSATIVIFPCLQAENVGGAEACIEFFSFVCTVEAARAGEAQARRSDGVCSCILTAEAD